MLSTDLEIRRLMALRAIESGLLRLKWLAAATRFELTMRRHDRALKVAYKAGFNPAQPRDEIGRWTDGAGKTGPSNLVRLAGQTPTGEAPEIQKSGHRHLASVPQLIRPS
jgi:hypothetical protein